MENRGRRQGREFDYRQGAPNAKPAQSEMRGSSMPSWEKRFCYLVGGMRWKKFLQNKPYTMLCEKVMEYWDDSAVEEAFINAKSRFWAKINNLPCDLFSPDPDANIEVIDWDSPVDENLYREVELEWQRMFLVVEEPAPPAAPEEPKMCHFLTREEILLEMKGKQTGWGDETDAKPPQSYDWENKTNECSTCYDNRRAGSRFPPASNYGFQGNRRYRQRGKNANAYANGVPQKYPPRQWRKKPLAQV